MKRLVLGTGLCILFFKPLSAQIQTGPQLAEKLVKVVLPKTEHEKSKRKLLHFESKAAYYNPLNYIGAGLLYIYQNLLSEQIQARCSYETSCSQYTKLSIQRNGFIKGTLSGFNQLSECFPSVATEHNRQYINREGKVINCIDGEGE
jgi:putative component of membrane protein insertase Oxa1/YidC/SpoIIIJ protein YidD